MKTDKRKDQGQRQDQRDVDHDQPAQPMPDQSQDNGVTVERPEDVNRPA